MVVCGDRGRVWKVWSGCPGEVVWTPRRREKRGVWVVDVDVEVEVEVELELDLDLKLKLRWAWKSVGEGLVTIDGLLPGVDSNLGVFMFNL